MCELLCLSVCLEQDQVVLSETGVRVQRHTARPERGRWSAPDAVESVDLDTLLEAPSPPSSARERRQRKKCVNFTRLAFPPDDPELTTLVCDRSRDKSRNMRKQSSADGESGAGGLPPRCVSRDNRVSFGRWLTTRFPSRPPNHRRGRAGSSKRGRAQTEARRKAPAMLEEEAPVYHSYEDPGYLGGDIELTHFDSDCILGSPPDSPTVIHARWGEPVDDPDEESVCTEYTPNPFKLGFCVNCQKQHDVTDSGDVVSKKEYKKIARPVVSKTAANALDNPAALANANGPAMSPTHPPGGRESDVDLAALLQQRREVLLKLNKLEQEKARIKKGTAANGAPVSSKRSAFGK